MRKARAKKNYVAPDPKFGDTLVTSFVNNLMLQGKKSTAFKIFYDALDRVQKKAGDEEEALEIFKRGLSNVTPQVEVRSRRVGGATFQIPQEIRQSRKLSMGMKWMISFARKRNGRSMAEKLADEILASSKEEGGAFKRKEDTHRMAEANKAFSHFRF
ncbi:MAG: 30S ribosomal protein S7 [Flavobacteriales bacterium]|nr:30S ribosomal protein S7 [Flavobacteriales bacterium]